MRSTVLILLFVFTSILTSSAQTADKNFEVIRSKADGAKGFYSPYYLFIPAKMREPNARRKTFSLLVIPNNTGKISDDLAVHEEVVKRRIPKIGAELNEKMTVAVLIPVFPRPETRQEIYTHSLDRDIFTTDIKEYKRLDLQLLKMIDDAQAKMKSENIQTEEKVLMQGYSASGMFVNRFVFLHPERVKAAAIGAPGGWAIVPTSEYKKKILAFPVGTGDFKEISGKKFDIEKVRKVSLFMILGSKDTNDAVPTGDAYDERESKLVTELFGKTPFERWKYSEMLYREAKMNAEFKLYPNADHQITPEMREDTINFIKKYVR